MDAASTQLRDSGSPQRSTTLGTPPCLPLASTTDHRRASIEASIHHTQRGHKQRKESELAAKSELLQATASGRFTFHEAKDVEGEGPERRAAGGLHRRRARHVSLRAARPVAHAGIAPEVAGGTVSPEASAAAAAEKTLSSSGRSLEGVLLEREREDGLHLSV